MIIKFILILFFFNISFFQDLDSLQIKELNDPDVALFLSLLPFMNLADPNEVVTIPSFGQLYNKKPLKASTMMIIDLVKTNSLLSRIIESQQRENELLTLKMSGWLDWERHRKKFTNKRFIKKEH